MKAPWIFCLLSVLAISLSLQSQTATNAPSALEQTSNENVLTELHRNPATNFGGAVAEQAQVANQSSISNRFSGGQLQQNETSIIPTPGTRVYTLTPDDVKALVQQGYDPATLPKQVLVETDEARAQREKMERLRQASTTPTPPDLKNAMVWLDNFLGATNTTIPADVISMKPGALKFQLLGRDYDYSGHYTVLLNTPRQHKNPYFGFGSPDKAKFVILEDFGEQAMPLPNVTIWEKRSGFIDVESLGKEWIYSGPFTIQN